ncbi:MAG: pectate lyase [Hyphomonadaceae bacterium]|nr:pectate lyase [Hyphomonadaceae bacterium]
MTALSRRTTLIGLGAWLSACATQSAPTVDVSSKPQGQAALDAMKRATRFMTDTVAYRGGYVWAYLPDFTRSWGEMEARRTMLWVQPPGTATMGHAFLDAYHATGDEQFWRAAVAATRALIAAQHPSGGWNYIHDFAGEASLKDWYATIGASGWRLEEFQHYYGNATFDDAGTSEASQLMLRMHLEKKGDEFRAPLEHAIRFVLDSQYPVGGWPQRFPFAEAASLHGMADYTRHITFNDDVAGENIKFLIMVWQTMGDKRAIDPIKRAMDCFKATQQPKPQAAWGLQHAVADLEPAAARSYEPLAFVTHTTANNISQLMNFYELTGDLSYLERVGEALDWLDSVKLPAGVANDRRTHPTFIEIGSNRPLYVHRKGSNVVNGAYYATYDLEGSIVHYSPTRAVRTEQLRARLAKLQATSPEDASKNSPLKASQPLPRYFTTQNIEVSDLNSNRGSSGADAPADEHVAKLAADLNGQGYWSTPLVAQSNPYTGQPAPTRLPAQEIYATTRVGDSTDTSPYVSDDPPIGISVGAYIQNMAVLSQYVSA